MKHLLLIICCFCSTISKAQMPDSVAKTIRPAKDASSKKTVPLFEPRKATIRSAIAPGWGQIYNKKYWKLPLVWGALGTTAGIYFYNVKYYRSLKQAYIYRSDNDPTNDILVDQEYRNLSAESIRSYRNSFRQSVDYSVLFFILFWGLNVVDATVDAHLKAFDVSDDLSLQLKPGYSQMSNTSGISLVLNIGKRK
ncbi:MAG TPA: DUF5683 domain-containing protein [Ferruginibacter sp.]|nr:DUF5683 domain-containing protein [Ferruginibacter sp.]